MQTLPALSNFTPNDNLSSYLQAVNAAPVLTVQEEHDLAVRYHNQQDLDAARTLVVSHLRHVVKVARGFSGYGLPLPDLIQEGSIGLMKAVKRFEPERGIRLVTFAMHWIRAEIYDYVVRNWKMVKVATTKAQRKLFFNLRKSRNQLGWMDNQEVDDLAHKLDVDSHVVREMESRMSGQDISFDGPLNDDDEHVYSPSQHLGDSTTDPLHVVTEKQSQNEQDQGLLVAMHNLDERSRDIITRRWLNEEKPTLHDLADEYGISAERIRQIEKQAMKKMRGSIESLAQ